MRMWRLILSLLGACLLLARTHAHEPYLLLTANADGTFTAEAGFSDGVSVAGLKLIVRDRGTGEVRSEHTVPASGKLTLPIPPAPYRVVFEGGSGHRISKPGPEREAAADPSNPVPPPPAAGDAPPVAPAPAPATTPTALAPPTTSAPRDDTPRVVLIVGIFFLFGSIAFALGYGAGRRAR
jgi:hypothetical protein